MKKICAGILTYNSDILKLKKNIEAIINQVSKILIIDNNSTNFEEIQELLKKYPVSVIKNYQNLGIARALNQLCEFAINENFDYILTLDQDSISSINLVENLSKYMDNNVAIVAPNVVYKNNEKFAIKKEGIEYVDWVITSASLMNLKLWKEIKFDEKLFIDSVDVDYCIRANRLGYKIIKNLNVKLLHELGDLKCKKFLGRIIYVTNHSATRKYYMARNVIYLDKKLNQHNSFRCITKNILKTIFFEKEKIVKLKAIFKGIKDGINM